MQSKFEYFMYELYGIRNNYKGAIMNKKFSIVLACILLASSVFVGCDNDSSGVSNSNNTSATLLEQEKTTEPETIEATTEPSTKENTSGFDMDKALKDTYLCGVQLAPDLTWGMFGKDFSLDPENSYSYPDSGKILCDVNYEGLYIGQFFFQDCKTVDGITSSTAIESIIIDTKDIEGFDIPVISVNGLTLNSTHEELYVALGDDYEIGMDDSQIKYLENGKRRYLFGFRDIDGDDKLAYILIKFK